MRRCHIRALGCGKHICAAHRVRHARGWPVEVHHSPPSHWQRLRRARNSSMLDDRQAKRPQASSARLDNAKTYD